MTVIPSKLTVVVGGQFGSEGKGAICAHLGSAKENLEFELVYGVRVAGPNAGHTVLGHCPNAQLARDLEQCGNHHQDGAHPWRLRQVPVTAVTNEESVLVLAAGSEIDVSVLVDELRLLDDAGYNASGRLIVDASATILEPRHQVTESEAGMTARLGSTGKGIGAARVDRLNRTAKTVAHEHNNIIAAMREAGIESNFKPMDTAHTLNVALASSGYHVIIEGTQGYGLGLHTEFYPYTTSSDCRAVDFLAMAGISPWVVDTTNPEQFEVWVVLRAYPIRVAGNSGPLRGETSWDNLGLAPEFTTVTRKTRRVGDWDAQLAAQAVRANGGGYSFDAPAVVRVALTMADHVVDGLSGVDSRSFPTVSNQDMFRAQDLVDRVTSSTRVAPSILGTSPNTVIDLRVPGNSEAMQDGAKASGLLED